MLLQFERDRTVFPGLEVRWYGLPDLTIALSYKMLHGLVGGF
jgi:hypothetical protein